MKKHNEDETSGILFAIVVLVIVMIYLIIQLERGMGNLPF